MIDGLYKLEGFSHHKEPIIIYVLASSFYNAWQQWNYDSTGLMSINLVAVDPNMSIQRSNILPEIKYTELVNYLSKKLGETLNLE